MTTTAQGRGRDLRDDDFWTAVQATYAAGVSITRTCQLFGIARSTFLKQARETSSPPADLACEANRAASPSTAELTAPLAADAPDAAAIMPKALAAADIALKRAAEAAARADAVEAEAAVRLGERLVRTANVLGRTTTPKPLKEPDEPPEGRRNALLLKIDQALEGGRQARRQEVAALAARGVDPREGWVWEEDYGDWVWDPGGALTRASTQPTTCTVEDESTTGGSRPDGGEETRPLPG